MIKINNVLVTGWESAVRGARNPMNSWNRTDSHWENSNYVLGDNDYGLLMKLSKAGQDHGKFLRYLICTLDITAPLYWWKEFDTYKIGTVSNSCSTMHKIHSKEFTLDDFSTEHLSDEHINVLMNYDEMKKVIYTSPLSHMDYTISILNAYRERFLETQNKDDWWQMIQLLPSSYNQLRTIELNYAVLKNIYFARKNHKLDEWHVFCDWIKSLPYSQLIIGEQNE